MREFIWRSCRSANACTREVRPSCTGCCMWDSRRSRRMVPRAIDACALAILRSTFRSRGDSRGPIFLGYSLAGLGSGLEGCHQLAHHLA